MLVRFYLGLGLENPKIKFAPFIREKPRVMQPDLGPPSIYSPNFQSQNVTHLRKYTLIQLNIFLLSH